MEINSEIRSFVIFVILAVIRTIIDLILWRFLVWVFQEDSLWVKISQRFGLNRYALAQALSFVVSAIISYVSNKEYAFESTQADSLWLYFKFGVVTGLGLLSSVWVIEFLTTNNYILAKIKPYPIIQKHWPLLAKLATIFVTLVINYFGMRFWVFVE
jgi:putative flippase GtrA